MIAARVRRMPPRSVALVGSLTALALLGSASLRPVAAAGLSDFLKKGDKKTEERGNSSGSSSPTVRREAPSGQGSSLGSILKKPERREPDSRPAPSVTTKPAPSTDTTSPRRAGSLFDILRKRAQDTAGTTTPDRPGTTQQPRNPPSAGGGLIDIFQKPGRTQVKRPAAQPVTRPPAVVVQHYYDPWYHPYDRVFYDYYGPWVLQWRDLDAVPYGYDRSDLYERRAEEALREIERGWQERNYRLIANHVDGDGTVAIYHDGRYSHAMSAREFRAITVQAFDDVRTIRFRFYDVRMRGDTEVVAAGEHHFIGPDGEERRVDAVYVLRRTGRHWLIRSIDLCRERRSPLLTPVAP